MSPVLSPRGAGGGGSWNGWLDALYQAWSAASLTTWWPMTPKLALAVPSVYRAVAIYGDQIGSMPVDHRIGRVDQDLPAFVTAPTGIPIGWGPEIRQLCTSMLLRGDGYAAPTSYDPDGWPLTWETLNPDAVGWDAQARAYHLPDGRVIRWPADPLTLLHVRAGVVGPGSHHGVGVLDALGLTTISTAATVERFTADTFNRGPIPPTALVVPQTLGKEQAAELKEAFVESLQRGRGAPAVLSGGVKLDTIAVFAEQLQLLEQRRWNATAIAVSFGLPAHLLGGTVGDSLAYSTPELDREQLWNMALWPMATTLEKAFSTWVPAGVIRFNFNVILRPDPAGRAAFYAAGIRDGWLTPDEARVKEDLPPLPDGYVPPTLPPAPAPVPAVA